ncbi:MAG: signal peptidase II [Chloroflexota bacterium]
MNKKTGISKYFIFATALILLDQATKLAIKGFSFGAVKHEGIEYGSVIPVIGNFLQITYIENAGMAFGITFGVWKIFLSLFSIIAAAALGWYLSKLSREIHPGVKIGISLIFAGAVGNLVDRVFYGVLFGDAPIFYGRVVDFIQVDIPDVNFFNLFYTHFPIFNVADSCVTVGVIALLLFHKSLPSIGGLLNKDKERIETSNAENAGENQ